MDRERRGIGGVTTAFLDHGIGEPLVALHGIPTSSALFIGLIPYLKGFRVLAPDLLGQGETHTPRAGRVDYSAYQAHLKAFLDEVPPPSFNLLVHDLGGVLGLSWALDNPDRVRCLTILSTTVIPSWRVGLFQAVNLICGRRGLRRALPLTLKGRHSLDPEILRLWAEPWTRRRCLRGMDHFGREHLREIRQRLPGLRKPVLLIWGQEDNIFPVHHARDLERRVPGARLVTIPGCGHWSPLDAPEEVAGQVREFCGVVS